MKIDIKPPKISTSFKAQKIYPELEDITITPTTEEQKLKSDKYGYDEITVNKVTADIDEDIKPENIKAGVNILGVDGGYEGIDTSDATATAGDILYPKTAYINNEKVTGAIQEYDGAYSGNTGTSQLELSLASIIDDSCGANVTELPESLNSIRSYAFYGCANLALTELPEGITEIGEYAFYNCTNLALTKLPSELKTIGARTLAGCTNLEIKELPSGVTSIPIYLFYNCQKITELTCKAEEISLIGTCAFQSCSKLTKIILTNIQNVPTIGSTIFKSTPIESGTGYIYVPDNLVDSFKSAKNWAIYAGQIKGLSELEA